ncbi:MAG TPA: CBS domain-containing protein [Planctomycetota bacterium]|nr:CBS domain-containing protein [Planctomycetota bacterium]
MNVNELMSREPRAVRIVDRLDAAARVLWEHDCGIAPVVDGDNLLVGVLTDRDLCMAAYTQGRAIYEIPVATVMARSVRTCRPDDPLAAAMSTMQQAQVHRLPVVDARGVLIGMLSTNDLVRAAQSRPAAVDGQSVLRLLAAIAAPRRAAAPVVRAVIAAPATQPAVAAAAASAPAAPATAIAGSDAARPAKAGKSKARPKGRKA